MSGSGGSACSPGSRLVRVGERGGERPAGDQMRVHPLEHGNPAVAPAEYLHELHRSDHERERRAQVEAAGVGRHGGHVRGALGEDGEQVRVAVERHHLVAVGREVDRHPPGARAEVEDRPARAAASSRQSGRSAS